MTYKEQAEVERLREAITRHRDSKWPRDNFRYDDFDAALYRAAGIHPYDNAGATPSGRPSHEH